MQPEFSCGLFVTLADACNINCSFCIFPKQKQFRTGNELNYEKFLVMLEGLRIKPSPVPLGAVCFCGSGEPLLFDKATQIVAETKKYVSQVSLVTNGLLLTANTAKELLESNINHIVISITGCTSAVYNEYQGNGQSEEKAREQLERVLHNVEQLIELRKTMPYINTRVGISYILHEDSRKDLLRALNYYRSIGVDYVDVRMRSTGFSLTEKDFEIDLEKNKQMFDTQGGACSCFGKVMNVSTDGTLRFCNCAYREETVIGNIYEQPLADILSSRKFSALLDAFHHDYDEIPDYCKICDLRRARPILA